MSLILPNAVAALAYKRLVEVSDRLRRKVNTARYEPDIGFLFLNRTSAVVVNDVERRVQGLAEAARDLFRAPDPVDLPLDAAIPAGMSKFAALGATALEWAAAAEQLAAHPWVANAMRRGTPDPNRSHVTVSSTSFLVAAANEALTRAGGNDERVKIRAYAMGLASAVATNVVLSPIQRGMWEQRTTLAWSRREPRDAVAIAEQRAVADLLGGAARFQGWMPAEADVPAAIHDGYIVALEAAYGFPSTLPVGFADFQAGFTAEELTAQRLRSTNSFLFQQVVTAQWPWWQWLLVLTPGLVAVPVALAAAHALPNARHFYGPGAPGEAGVYELLTMAMGLGSLGPFGWSIYLSTQVPEHGGTFANVIVLGFVRVFMWIVNMLTYQQGASAAVRWLLQFGVPASTDLYALIRGIIKAATGQGSHAFVYFFNTYPAMAGAVSLLFAGLIKAIGDATGNHTASFWTVWALLTLAIVLLPGVLMSVRLANGGGIAGIFHRDGQLPALDALTRYTNPLPAGLAALFDDSTLWREGQGDVTLDQLRYPAGRRALVKVWWEQDGVVEISHDDHLIQLRKDGGDPIPVRLGPGDVTATTIAQKLRDALPGLQAEVVDAASTDLLLPYPKTLDDPGDRAPSRAQHDELAGSFAGVGATAEEAYVLAHTPRSELSTRFGQRGPTTSSLEGFRLVPSATLADLDTSALGLAAELAALLCMGLAPSLDGAAVGVPAAAGRPAVANPTADPVYQVFRRWNLDERRVNEWRMLVHGGAVSEKPAAAGAHEAGMRAHPNPGGYNNAAAAGEEIANLMGWVPLWRAWLRVAADPKADTLAATAEQYTPFVTRADGSVSQPTNAELSQAIRFLLDLR